MKKPLRPRTVLRLRKLWPHARKQGREVGQIYRVGHYCRHCGPDIVWLVDRDGKYGWTAGRTFIEKFFEAIDISNERSLYGRDKPEIAPLRGEQRGLGKGHNKRMRPPGEGRVGKRRRLNPRG